MNTANLVIDIIKDPAFEQTVNLINQNYFNLKQESFFRNAILEKLNAKFSISNPSYRAVAEYPRINGKRTDLSIISLNDSTRPYKIEFKYQFTRDFQGENPRVDFINNDYDSRNSDMFILIVAFWDTAEKNKFDEGWGVQNGLSKYISKRTCWEDNIVNAFLAFEQCSNYQAEQIEVDLPYKTYYHFYVLSKKVLQTANCDQSSLTSL